MNRASQRTFRERKEKHVKDLERQLEELYGKHQNLLSSYDKQTNEVLKLRDTIEALTAELSKVRYYQTIEWYEHSMTLEFENFDVYSL